MNRKIKADNIFTGREFTGPGHVLVLDELGRIVEIAADAAAGGEAEIYPGIICPGFVNAHCHIELSHLKNKIPQHTGLVDFVQDVMKQRPATSKEKEGAMEQAAEELYNSGTVAVGDICNTTDSILLKQGSKLYWHNFIEVSGFVNAGAEKRFEDGIDILKDFKAIESTDQPINRSALSPHAPYSVSKKLFELINEATDNKIISIHNQEAEAENELYKNKSGEFLKLYENFGIDISSFCPTGKSSFQSWLPYFTKGQKIISVHNTFTKTEDLQPSTFNLQPSTLFFCLCPNANLFIENALPPVELLVKNNCKIVLGTDSYASNTALNIYEEIKMIQQYFPLIPLANVLQWATLNGAMALGIDAEYGSFEKGKRPGVVLINEGVAKRI